MPMTPQSRPVPVIITRPEPAASRFARSLEDRFATRISLVLSPVLWMRPVKAPRPEGRFGALVFTSEAAVHAAKALGHWDLPKRAYCVGDHTTRTAAEAGFDAISAQGDASDLVNLLGQSAGHAPFLHLHGGEIARDVAEALQVKGIAAQSVAVYVQEEQPLTSAAKQLLSGDAPLILPVFSPRTARLILGQIRGPMNPSAQILCLSPAIAAVFGDHPCKITPRPDAPSMMRLIDMALIGA